MNAKTAVNDARWFTLTALLILLMGGMWGVWQTARLIDHYAHVPPDFDEAVHLLPVRQLAYDIRQGDWAAFLRHTVNQDQLAAYPFIHAWLTFPAWLALPGITTGRVMSGVYLAAAALVAFALGYDLVENGRYRWLSGFVAGALTLLAFPLWIYAGLAYLEGAGLLVTLLVLWFYGRSYQPEPTRAHRYAWLTSLALAVAFFTKYNFGFFLLGGLALNEVVTVWLERRQSPELDLRRWWQRWLALGGPAAILLLFWFLWPGHWARLVAFGNAQEGGLRFWQWASWLYYPRSLLTQYAAGLPVALLLLCGLGYGVWRWRQFRVRALLAYLVVSWLLLIVVPQKAPRFLYTVAPVIFVLAGGWVAATAVWNTHQTRRRQLGLVVVGMVWLVGMGTAVTQRFQLFDETLAAGYASAPETTALYRFIQERTLAQGEGVYLLNSWHLFSHPALLWTYYDIAPDSSLAYDDGRVAAGLVPEPTPANQAALIADLRERGIHYVATIDGSPAGDYSGWAMMEPLVARGLVEHVASSPAVSVPVLAFEYQEALMRGAYGDVATAVAQSDNFRNTITLQSHLYRIRE
jgi:hypothetical protein